MFTLEKVLYIVIMITYTSNVNIHFRPELCLMDSFSAYIYIQVCTKISISTSSQHIELVGLLFLVHVQPQNEVLGWLNTKYGSYFISAPYCKQIFSNVLEMEMGWC